MSTSATSSATSSTKYELHKPPKRTSTTKPSIFLSGSILRAPATDWRQTLTTHLSHLPIAIFNPDRPDWNFEEDMSDPGFAEQFHWEMDHEKQADMVAIYFAPGTQAPITLLELGLQAGKERAGEKVVVCCPEGFWKKGYAVGVCERLGIPVFGELEAFLAEVGRRMEELVGRGK